MATNSSNNNGSSNGKSNISIDNNSDDEKDSFDDGEKGTTYSNNSKVFVKSQYKSDTFPGPVRRKRSSTFGMSSVHQHNLLEQMKIGYKKGLPMMLSNDMLGELLELIVTAKAVNKKQTKLYLSHQISDFQQNNGKHITQESIHNTLYTFGALSMPSKGKMAPRSKKRSVKEDFRGVIINEDEIVELPFFTNMFPQDVKLLNATIENIRSWEFNVFDLFKSFGSDSKLTMQYVGISCLSRFRLFEILPIEKEAVWEYLGNIANDYKLVPYHNALHGVDVMQTMYSTLSNNIEMTSKLSNANVFAILIAAAVHDVGHPARNNQFLITTQHRLATVYHDQSVLENYHIARSMELMETEKWSLLSGFLEDEISDIRALMIKSILHTDMAKHGDLVRNLTLDLDHDGLDARLPKNHNRCLSLLLHAADISNPSKQWKIYRKWTDKIMEEFRAQYDDEEERGIGHGFFDPDKPIPEFQIGFIQFVVSPLFTQIDQIEGISMDLALHHLKRNLQAWKMQVCNRQLLLEKKKKAQENKFSNSAARKGSFRRCNSAQ